LRVSLLFPVTGQVPRPASLFPPTTSPPSAWHQSGGASSVASITFDGTLALAPAFLISKAQEI